MMDCTWQVTPGLTPYDTAVSHMEDCVAAIHAGTSPELLWLLEHPPLYTLGTSGSADDILRKDLPLYTTGRGGKATYHGPGQRIIYCLLNLKHRANGEPVDLRHFVRTLEAWGIAALHHVGITAYTHPDRVGLWVTPSSGGESKIGAVGIRIRHGVSYHGMALNICPDLSAYAGIIPCGLGPQYGVTSVAELTGKAYPLTALDDALRASCPFMAEPPI